MIAARLLVMGVLAAASLGVACEASPGFAITTDGKGGNCASCHMPEYQHAEAPAHVGVKPTTCAVCHGQEGWRPSVVHHEGWLLTGRHQGAECSFCHGKTPFVFKGTPKDCVACHRPEYDASPFPGHESFPTKCADCHATTGWRPATHPPPRAPDPVAPPLGRPAISPKLTPPGKLPRSNVPTRPVAPPAAPAPTRVPPPRPPPDVISRPSPLRR